jgi:hypothetical protein
MLKNDYGMPQVDDNGGEQAQIMAINTLKP